MQFISFIFLLSLSFLQAVPVQMPDEASSDPLVNNEPSTRLHTIPDNILSPTSPINFDRLENGIPQSLIRIAEDGTVFLRAPGPRYYESLREAAYGTSSLSTNDPNSREAQQQQRSSPFLQELQNQRPNDALPPSTQRGGNTLRRSQSAQALAQAAETAAHHLPHNLKK